MRSIVLIYEGNPDHEMISPSKEKAFFIFSKYRDLFDIREIRRIGFGSIRAHKVDANFDELTEQIYSKLYNSSQEVLNIVSDDTPRDVAFVIDGNKNGFRNHIEIGPTKKEECVLRFNSSFLPPKVLVQKIEEVTLLTNVDSFIENPQLCDITEELIEKLMEDNYRIENSYIDILNEENE